MIKIDQKYIKKAQNHKGMFFSVNEKEYSYSIFGSVVIVNKNEINIIKGIDLRGLFYIGININDEGKLIRSVFTQNGDCVAKINNKDSKKLGYIGVDDLIAGVYDAIIEDTEVINKLPIEFFKIFDELGKEKEKQLITDLFREKK